MVNFEQKDQVEMALTLKDMVGEFSAEFGAKAKEAVAELKAWFAQPFSAGNLLRALVVTLFILSLYLFWRSRQWVLGLCARLLKRPSQLDPVRKKAGKMIIILQETHGVGAEPEVLLDLQSIRFGPGVSREEAKAIFHRANGAIRRRRKRTAA